MAEIEVKASEDKADTMHYAKQRKHLTITFVICGLFLIGFIIFAFVSLPKYQANQNITHLLRAYESIRDIDHYINIQMKSGQLNEAYLRKQIATVTDNLNELTSNDAEHVKAVWERFKDQVSLQDTALVAVRDAVQFTARVESTSRFLQQDLVNVSQQLSESRSVSLETIRYIDQLANGVINLQANITKVLNSRSKIEIKTIADLTESLAYVQKGLNVLMVGSPADAVQSLQGLLEEESIIEAQFVFNQLARDVANLVQDISGVVFLNQMKINLQEEKDNIQTLLQSSIDHEYANQQSYIQTTNHSVFLISLIASLGIVLFFIVFAVLFLRLHRARLSVVSEKYKKDQRIGEVMDVIDKFMVLRDRLLPQLALVSSLNNESDGILSKGREVRESFASIGGIVKDMNITYDYLEQAFTHDLSLLKQNVTDGNINELRATLKQQLKFFTERKEELVALKQRADLVDEFFFDVVSNTSNSVVAYREVERELMLIISEIDQLNRDLQG